MCIRDRVATVVGFPLGLNTIETKVFETKDAIKNGVHEIDMVINISWAQDKEYNLINDEIKKIYNTTKDLDESILLKVIIETCYLDKSGIIEICRICKDCLLYTSLSKAIFPIGNMDKSQVRKIAEENKLKTAGKKDSTGICFIGERNFSKFINNYLPAKAGEIRTIEGEVKGKHWGLMNYTLGQRKGLGIGGSGTGEPWFVVDKDLKNNILYVAQGANHPALYSYGLFANDINWISDKTKESFFNCTAKFRYRQPDQKVKVEILKDNTCKVVFDKPQKARCV